MTTVIVTGNRADRLEKFIDEDRLIRRGWGDGVERACLLAELETACSLREAL